MKRDQLTWITAGCALIALLAAVGAAVIPAKSDDATLTWQSGDSAGVLLLARGWPQAMTLTAPCSGEPGTVETGEFRLDVNAGAATASVGPSTAPHTTLTLTPQGGAQNCSIEASFDASSGSLQLKSGFDIQQVDLERAQFPVVTRIQATGAAADSGYGVQITTRPMGSSPTLPQQILRLISVLALLVIAALSTLTWRRSRIFSDTPRSNTPTSSIPSKKTPTALSITTPTARLSAWDLPVVAVAIASAVLTPALLDDGWMRQISRHYASSGAFSNIFDNNDAWFPQGYWLQWLLQPLFGSDLPLVLVRLAVAAIVIATWFILRRAVLPRAGLPGRTPVAGAALVFLAGVPAWLLTLRSEPEIALLAVGVLAAGLAFWRHPRFESLTLALVLAAAAVAGHQTGWVAVTPLIVLVPALIRWLRTSPSTAVPSALTAVVTGAATGVLLLMLDTDRWLWLDGVRDFAAGGRGQGEYHAFALSRELDRWVNLLSDTVHAGSGARLFAVALAVVAAALALAAVGSHRQPSLRIAVAMAFAAWGGLFLTSSKWIWHLGALVPATAVLGAAGWFWFVDQGRRAPSRLARAVAVALLTLAVGVCLSVPRAWGVGDLATLTWPAFADTVGASGSRALLWLLLAVVALVVTYWIDARAWRGTALGALCAALLLVPAVASWSWLVTDATRSTGWSFLKQNLAAVAGQSSCGAAETAPVIVGASAPSLANPAPGIPVTAATELPPADPAAPPNSPVAPFNGLPSWGTWPVDAPTPSGTATGSFTSPWQSVTAGTTLAVWVRSPRASAMEATVRFADAAGSEFVTTPAGVPIGEYAEAGDYWRLTSLVVPPSAVLARVQVDDFSTRPDGWAAFTSLATTQSEPLSSIPTNTVFAGPFLALTLPCVPPTPVNDGVLAKIDYVIQPPAWQVRSLAGDAIGTQVSCEVGANWCAYRMDYPQAGVRVSAAPS